MIATKALIPVERKAVPNDIDGKELHIGCLESGEGFFLECCSSG